MKAVCTYCAGNKHRGAELLPAVRRYRSDRIGDLHKLARRQGTAFFILSGRFGLITAEQPIPWYDHLLSADEVRGLVPGVAAVLAEAGVTAISFHTADAAVAPQVAPYGEVIRQACLLSGLELEIVILPGDPL